jgi:cystathionine beta-lyase family protein involved in aluminum resistance
MTDFDNGLPPDGTDISDGSINSVSIATGELIESEGGRVTGAMVATGELITSEGGRVTGVMVGKEEYIGRNSIMFL